MRTLKASCIAAILGGFMLSLAGCHTVQGAGQDISAGGNAMQKAAVRNHPNNAN